MSWLERMRRAHPILLGATNKWPLSETFNAYADGTMLDAVTGFSRNGGASSLATITGGVVGASAGTASVYPNSYDPGSDRYYVRSLLTGAITTTGFGLAAQITDVSNMLVLTSGGPNWVIRQYIAGTPTTLATIAVGASNQAGASPELRIDKVAATVAIYLGATQIGTTVAFNAVALPTRRGGIAALTSSATRLDTFEMGVF